MKKTVIVEQWSVVSESPARPRITMLGAAFALLILYFVAEIAPALMRGGPVDKLKAQQEVRSCAGSATPELQADCMLRAEGAK